MTTVEHPSAQALAGGPTDGSHLRAVNDTGSPGVRTKRPASEHGVEVRVHGIGDHATYSALGTPRYKELVDSRVWIGEVPQLPPHELRLVNWSRANRKLTRHFSWYLAFPFTLLNVAGYMETPDKRRHFMRLGVAIASICLTVAMAAWITVILETVWRALTTNDDRLTGIVLQVSGPVLLAAFIVYRLVVGRALVDRAGAMISFASIAALGVMIGYLHTKPASRTDGVLHRFFVDSHDPTNAIDPMTTITVATTTLVWLIALGLAIMAIRYGRNGRSGAGLAGAALLLVLAISLLHAAGSILRLFAASILSIVPAKNAVQVHVPRGAFLRNVLLPKPDDLKSPVVANVGNALRIDLIPVFFLAMLTVVALIMWYQLWLRHRQANRDVPADAAPRKQATKPATRTHELVAALPDHLAMPVILAILATALVWVTMAWGFAGVTPWAMAAVLLGLKVLGAVAMVFVILRRPERLAAQVQRTFGSVADIAGFWAPDLHPLAGASYRRALLSGIRQAINDLVLENPDEPIALVGHSQGSVVCAWFVRGGHWTERRSEGQSDRHALKEELHNIEREPSNRIALFTCGSPLFTLYHTFFPRYFNDEFFVTTRSMTYGRSRWRNYWRKTDPIGSAMPCGAINVEVTEKIDDETLGHGEYWREKKLRNHIRGFFDSAEIKRRANRRAPRVSA